MYATSIYQILGIEDPAETKRKGDEAIRFYNQHHRWRTNAELSAQREGPTTRVVDSHVLEVGSDSSYVYAKIVKVWDDGQVSIDSVDLRRYR